MKFVVLQETNARWYWELRHAEGPPIARCTLGFSSKQNAIRSIQSVRARAPICLIFDPLGNLESEKADIES